MVVDRGGDVVAPRRDGKLRRIADPRDRQGAALRTLTRRGGGARHALELRRWDLAPPQAFDAGRKPQPVGGHALPQVGEQAIDDRQGRHGAF